MKPDTKFVIIEFVDEHTTAVVPQSWITKEEVVFNEKDDSVTTKAQCYWPPPKDRTKVTTYAKQAAEHKPNWKLHACIVEDQKYDSYGDARKALVEHSDHAATATEGEAIVNSEVLMKTSSKRRKRIHSPHSDASDAGNDDSSASSVHSLPDVSNLRANAADANPPSPKKYASSQSKGHSPLKPVTSKKTASPKRQTTPMKSHSERRASNSMNAPSQQRTVTPKRSAPQPRAVTPKRSAPQPRAATPKPSASQTRAASPRISSSRSKSQTPSKTYQVSNAGSDESSKRSTNPWNLKRFEKKSSERDSRIDLYFERQENEQRASPSPTGSAGSLGAEWLPDDVGDLEQTRSDSGVQNDDVSLNGTPQDQLSDREVFKTPSSSARKRLPFFVGGSENGSTSHRKGSGSSILQEMNGKLADLSQQLSDLRSDVIKILSCVQPALESNIAKDIPRLPLDSREAEKSFAAMLKKQEDFNKTVTFIYGLGGPNAHDAIYLAMKTLYTDRLAATKSLKGIHRTGTVKKDAFYGTYPYRAVLCAIKKRYREATVAEISDIIGNWLRDAPAREKKRLQRQAHRQEKERQEEDVESLLSESSNTLD